MQHLNLTVECIQIGAARSAGSDLGADHLHLPLRARGQQLFVGALPYQQDARRIGLADEADMRRFK
ncbi:Uncharacterised protein [Mycobacteroides abscessus subsp. massiliense]|nr:Uncharacterised protein [Mycobacteroides abscessus subsp. massiliense]